MYYMVLPEKPVVSLSRLTRLKDRNVALQTC